MKKVLLVVALLLLAAPVFAADVTITATKVGSPVGNLQQVDIGYSGAAVSPSPAAISAFALSLTTDSNAVMSNIRGFKRGESNSVSKGYGIFPARFRQNINPLNGTDVNSYGTGPGSYGWQDSNYNPLAVWGDPNAGWGINTAWIVTELGTLYSGDANAPVASGTLFTIDVNSVLGNDCNLCIALDQIRGGVVRKDTTAATVTLPPGGSGAPANCIRITYVTICTVPNVVNQAEATATGNIVGAGFTLGTRTTAYDNTIVAGNVISTAPAAGATPACGSSVAYVVSLGKFPTPSQLLYPSYDSDCNVPVYWSAVTGATGYTLQSSHDKGTTWTAVYSGTGTYKLDTNTPGWYRYRISATNGVSTSDWRTGTVDANVYLSTCYKTTADVNYAQWVLVGRPDCWCKASTLQEPNGSGYQCDGDADGIKSSAGYRVYSGDSAILAANWKFKSSNMQADPNVTLAGKLKICGACADFDHKASSAGYRVYSADSAVLSAKWKFKDSSVTSGNRLAGNCPR